MRAPDAARSPERGGARSSRLGAPGANTTDPLGGRGALACPSPVTYVDPSSGRAHVDRGRPAARGRPRGGEWLRGAADLHEVGRAMARTGASAGGDRALPRARPREWYR